MIQLYMSLIDDEQDKLRFEIAYYKYRNLLHYKARSILKDEHRAEDAVQEVFMRIAKNFHKVGDINSPQTRNFFVLITERVALNIAWSFGVGAAFRAVNLSDNLAPKCRGLR